MLSEDEVIEAAKRFIGVGPSAYGPLKRKGKRIGTSLCFLIGVETFLMGFHPRFGRRTPPKRNVKPAEKVDVMAFADWLKDRGMEVTINPNRSKWAPHGSIRVRTYYQIKEAP